MSHREYGPWSIVVGGSEGIGQAFAFELARRGSHVAIVARSRERLETTADEIRARHMTIDVRTLPIDLEAHDAVESIERATTDIDIGCLIYNVGAETRFDDFIDHERESLLSRLQRNVIAQTALVHHFANHMRERGGGAIVLMGSISGFGGAPGTALYAAGKAYVHTLGESLWYELKKHSIDVLTPVIGPTNTPTMTRAFGGFADAADPTGIAQGALDHVGDGPLWIHERVEQVVAERLAMAPADRPAAIAQRLAALGEKPSDVPQPSTATNQGEHS